MRGIDYRYGDPITGLFASPAAVLGTSPGTHRLPNSTSISRLIVLMT